MAASASMRVMSVSNAPRSIDIRCLYQPLSWVFHTSYAQPTSACDITRSIFFCCQIMQNQHLGSERAGSGDGVPVTVDVGRDGGAVVEQDQLPCRQFGIDSPARSTKIGKLF